MRKLGTEGPVLTPGSPEWQQTMSASKVAAVLGLSPWESRFSTWHKMAGIITPPEPTTQMKRGHYLEPAICQWFADQYPEYKVGPSGTWTHPEHSWATATPDRLVYADEADGMPSYLLEVKTSSDAEEWGQAGTDEIPVYYRVQCMWQMDVTGLDTCHVAVLLPYLEFKEYVVRYDPAEADEIRGLCREFMDSITQGIRPELDATTATYDTVRELHPNIVDDSVELPYGLAAEFVTARRDLEDAEARKKLTTSQVADHMGEARKATFGDFTIARRQSRKGNTPHIVAVDKPDFTSNDQFQGDAA